MHVIKIVTLPNSSCHYSDLHILLVPHSYSPSRYISPTTYTSFSSSYNFKVSAVPLLTAGRSVSEYRLLSIVVQ